MKIEVLTKVVHIKSGREFYFDVDREVNQGRFYAVMRGFENNYGDPDTKSIKSSDDFEVSNFTWVIPAQRMVL